MLATIHGKVAELMPAAAVIEINGLGYLVNLTKHDLQNAKLAKPLKLYLYEHIREDAHDLYGFVLAEAKLLFEQLISVSGVGPKVAMAIISAAGTEQLSKTIAAGQTDLLLTVPGVGKKVAARIVVELRSKIGKLPPEFTESSDSSFAALRQLGFTTQQSRQALSKVPASISSEEQRLRLALKELGK